MKMLRLTSAPPSPNRGPVHINPLLVTAIIPNPHGDGAQVNMAQNCYQVKEDVGEVTAQWESCIA